MPSRESDAFVLRSYPYREADLIVSFFTRERGKLRGVARGVRRPKNKFGVALERLARSRLFYLQKENLELVTLQRAELAGPANLWKAEYSTSVVLDVIAEASDRLLPENQPQDAYFRLLQLVVEEFRRGIAKGESGDPVPPWAHRALVYFLLWSARLGGWLPPLDHCSETNQRFAREEQVFFGSDRDGLFRAEFKNRDSWPFPTEARALAGAMLKKRVDKLDESAWQASAALALQRFLLQRTHAQLEGRLRGVNALRALWHEGTSE
jgi:DNA repair protein RecO (recombination protein O)